MVLQTLAFHKEMKMTELATFLGLSKANATGLVDRLVKRRMVSRRHSSEDRRVVFIRLTPSGRTAAERLATQQRRGLVEMMNRIPEKNLRMFIDTLEQVALGLVERQGRAVVRPTGR